MGRRDRRRTTKEQRIARRAARRMARAGQREHQIEMISAGTPMTREQVTNLSPELRARITAELEREAKKGGADSRTAQEIIDDAAARRGA